MRIFYIPDRSRSLGQVFDPSVAPFDCSVPIGGLCDDQLRIKAKQVLDQKFSELAAHLIPYSPDYICQMANQVIQNVYDALAKAYAACSFCWGEFDYSEIDQYVVQKLNELGLGCAWVTLIPGGSDNGGGTDYGQSTACASRGGRCQSGNCAGTYQSNLCPGPTSWRCCIPGASTGGGGTQNPLPKPKDKTADYVAYGMFGIVGIVLFMNLTNR